MSTKLRNIYKDALKHYAGKNFDSEMLAALERVQEKRHDELVGDVAEAIHDELMESRREADPKLAAVYAEAVQRGTEIADA